MKPIISLFLLLCAISCTSKQQIVNNVDLPFNVDQKHIASLLVDSITYIPLESNELGLFNSIDKLMVGDDKFFICSLHGVNCLLAFDMQGKFMFRVGLQGRGPQEYVKIRNFTIDDNYIYVLDNDSRKMLMYSIENGEYVGSKEMTIIAFDMAVFKNGDYMFATSPVMQGARLAVEQPACQIVITTSDMEIKETLFPFNDDDCTELSKFSYFTQNDDSIVFNASVSDTVVVFSKSSAQHFHTYSMDFGENKVPSGKKNNLDQLFDYQYLATTPFMSGRYMVGEWNATDRDGSYIYDLKTKQVYVNAMDDDMNNHLLTPLGGYDNKVVALCDSYDILYLGLVKYGFTPAPKAIEQHLEQGNPVLVVYSFYQNPKNIPL